MVTIRLDIEKPDYCKKCPFVQIRTDKRSGIVRVCLFTKENVTLGGGYQRIVLWSDVWNKGLSYVRIGVCCPFIEYEKVFRVSEIEQQPIKP